MNKLENIKVGDSVLICVVVGYGWGNGRSFYVKRQVERLTKTQFIVSGNRYKKDTGNMIGGIYSSRAVIEGDKHWGDSVYTDQTVECDAFKNHLKLLNTYESLHSKLPSSLWLDSDDKIIESINQKISELSDLIETIRPEKD